MRIAGRTARVIGEKLGVDAGLFARKAKNLFRGLAKGEKKKLSASLIRIASKGKANPAEVAQLRTLIGRTRPATAAVEVDAMLSRVETGRVLGDAKSLGEEISQNLSESIRSTLTITFSPECINNIAKESIKEYYRSIPSELAKSAFKPIAFVMRQFGVKKGAEWPAVKAGFRKAPRVIGYPVTYLTSKFIPKAERAALKELTKLPREQFGQGYYQFLLDSRGLKGRAPSSYTVTKGSAPLFTECYGLTNRLNNTMTFTRELPQLSFYKQANLIRHEMTHYQQIEAQIQAFGIDGYIQSLKTSELNILAAENPNKTRQELIEMIDKEWKADNVEEIIKKAFAGASELPRIPKGTKQYAQALKYRQATESYIPPKTESGMFFTTVKFGKGYTESGLEKEAYKKGFWAGVRTKIIELLNL